MRFTAASILGKRPGPTQSRPGPGTKIGRIYDRLLADEGLAGVSSAELAAVAPGKVSDVVERLRNDYWCDIRFANGLYVLYSTPDDDRLARKMGAAA